MKTSLAALILVASLLCSCHRTQQSDPASNDFLQYKENAELGASDAQYMVGVCYLKGQGVEKDYTQSVKWFRKAAEQGDADAQYMLGRCYVDGAGVQQDHTEGVKWWRKAAEQGSVDAEFNLAYCYRNGVGTDKNYTEALKWFRKAAEQGAVDAQYMLGVCYAYGESVEQNDAESVKWFRKAADQGYANAQAVIGSCYYNGKGVKQNYAEAAKWYRKAAEQGYASAQDDLGLCYANGEGVEKNHVEAYAWYDLASKTRKEATQARDQIEKTMSRQQVADAQKSSAELAQTIKTLTDHPTPEDQDNCGQGVPHFGGRKSQGASMFDFIASLAVLLAVMFSGVASWLLLPVIVAIRLPLRRLSVTGDAWGKLLSDLVGIYFLVSLAVQLTQDHQNRGGASTAWYPYINGLLLFVFTLEASIDTRQEIIREASKWTQYPELVPDIRFWKVVPIVVLPLFFILLLFPIANVPYVYLGFSAAIEWLFHLRFIGSVLYVLAEILGACLFVGCLKYLLFRTCVPRHR